MLNPKGFSTSLFGQYVMMKKRRETSGRQSSHRVPPLPKRGLQSNNAAKSVECCSQQLFLGLRVRYRGGGEENFQRLTRLLRLRESLSVTVAVTGSAIANGGKKRGRNCPFRKPPLREREREKGSFSQAFLPLPSSSLLKSRLVSPQTTFPHSERAIFFFCMQPPPRSTARRIFSGSEIRGLTTQKSSSNQPYQERKAEDRGAAGGIFLRRSNTQKPL